jgi:hypothetical protein
MLFSIVSQFGMGNALGINPLGLTERQVSAQAVALIEAMRDGSARMVRS